jgi:hypothetical protein
MLSSSLGAYLGTSTIRAHQVPECAPNGTYARPYALAVDSIRLESLIKRLCTSYLLIAFSPALYLTLGVYGVSGSDEAPLSSRSKLPMALNTRA